MRPLAALLAAALLPGLAAPAAAAGADQGWPLPVPTAPAGPVSGLSGVAAGTGSTASAPLGPYAGPAAPVGGTRTWTACGGPSAQSVLCTSVWVNVSGLLTTVRVQNLSGARDVVAEGRPVTSAGQWVVTTVGFDGLPPSVAAILAYSTTGSWRAGTGEPGTWTSFNDAQFGIGERIDVGIDNGAGISGGVASSCAPLGTLPGGSNRLWMTPNAGCDAYALAATGSSAAWMETRFVTTAAWDPTDDAVALYFKGQNGPGGGSYECLVGGAAPRGGCFAAGTLTGVAVGAVGAVVPEPGTLLLFGTGVAGIAAAAARRRRALAAPVPSLQAAPE